MRFWFTPIGQSSPHSCGNPLKGITGMGKAHRTWRRESAGHRETVKGIQGHMRGGGLLSLGGSTKGSVSMQWELGKEDTPSLTHGFSVH